MIDFQELSKDGDFHHKTMERSEFLSCLKEFKFSLRDLTMILRLAETRRTRRQASLLLRPSSKCFIFDVENIKLLCFSDKCLIFNPEDKTTQNFIRKLHVQFSGANPEEFKEYSMKKVLKLLKQDSNQEHYVNFEHVVLETALDCVVNRFKRTFGIMKPALEMVLQQTTENPETSGLRKLLSVKNSLIQFDQSLEHTVEIIENLLSNDKDMLKLYLSDFDKKEGLENLLESYHSELDLIETESKILAETIEDTEQFISAHMDSLRNEIMRMSLFLEIGGFIMTFGAVVGGIFGMNLKNSYEEDKHAFSIVCISMLVAMLGMVLSFWKRILKLKADTSTAQKFTLLKSFFTYVDDLEYHVSSKRISKPEFKNAVEQITGLKISEKESEFLFRMVDANKDGVFDVEGEHEQENTENEEKNKNVFQPTFRCCI